MEAFFVALSALLTQLLGEYGRVYAFQCQNEKRVERF